MQDFSTNAWNEANRNVSVYHSRRHFIRNFLVGTVTSTLLGKSWVGTLLADCQPAQPSEGILRVRISDFPALQNANGSVRLALNPFTFNGPQGAFYPVLINRGANNQFFSLSARCTHEGCVVPTFNAAAGASVCPCHGSRYGLSGNLLQGPAFLPLSAYAHNFDGTILCVRIPNLGFSVTATAVQAGVGPRLQLRFATRQGVKYQVFFRQSLDDAGIVIPFATTSEGNASATVFNGTGAIANLFVNRANEAGLYSVGVQVTQG